MEARKATFHVYADSDDEVHNLELALYDFVASLSREGIAVTARKTASAVRKLTNSGIIKSYYNGK